jgi:small lipoprotein (TIGR04454 family)
VRALTALVFVLALASCGKTKKEGNDCEGAVSRGVDQTIAKRRGSDAPPMTPAEQEVPPKLKAALGKLCVDDKWSKETIDCLKTAEDIATCKAMLTPEQRMKYGQTVMGVMTGSRGSGEGMSMPPHAMPPSTGSADGSAAPAGSAPAPAGSGSAAPAGSGSN